MNGLINVLVQGPGRNRKLGFGLMVVIFAFYLTPPPTQAESFSDSYKQCYAKGSRFRVPDYYSYTENNSCAEEGFLACGVVEQYVQENWYDARDNCNAILKSWNGANANFQVEISFKIAPTDRGYHNESYANVYVFLASQTCPNGQLFNPYKESCETFCTNPGESWMSPAGNCGIDTG